MDINQPNYIYKGYHFEIEKYLHKLSNNPYIDEIYTEIQNKKKKKLLYYLNHKIINIIPDNLINLIFEKIKTDEAFKYFTKDINNKLLNFDVNDKNAIIYLIESNLNKFNLNTFNKNLKITIEPTKLRISTMTVCCDLSCQINTVHLYNKFLPPENILQNGGCLAKKTKYKSNIKNLIIGCKAENYETKGYFDKEKKSNFYNSAALNLLIFNNKCINIKVFKNGKIQMTGVPSEEVGKKAVNIIINYLKNIPNCENTDNKIVNNLDDLNCRNFRIVLINSDYFCGYQIKRENLNRLLIEKYNLIVSFESENYPGVKLEYFWNKNTLDTEHEGRCICDKKCLGKGDGLTKNNCKKITVSTFQSGKVIVTGARNTEQLYSAYNYINKVFNDNYFYLKKETKIISKKIIANKNNSKLYFLKKNKIRNYNKLIEHLKLLNNFIYD